MEEILKSRLVLGTAGLAGLWGAVDQRESIQVLHRAWEWGITHVDTAPAYADAEILLSKALQQWSGPSPVISTKVGKLSSPDPDALCMDYRPAAIRASVEESLHLFRRDVIDRVFLHDPTLMKPEEIEPAMEALVELQQSGKIRSIGIGGNFDTEFTPYATSGVFDCFMGYNRYNAIVQSAAEEEFPLVRSAGLEIWQASPLYMGLLGRRYEQLIRTSPEWIVKEHLERARFLHDWCADRGASMPALAVHFLMGSTWPERIVLGASGMQDLEETFSLLVDPHMVSLAEEWRALLKEGGIFGKKVH